MTHVFFKSTPHLPPSGMEWSEPRPISGVHRSAHGREEGAACRWMDRCFIHTAEHTVALPPRSNMNGLFLEFNCPVNEEETFRKISLDLLIYNNDNNEKNRKRKKKCSNANIMFLPLCTNMQMRLQTTGGS